MFRSWPARPQKLLRVETALLAQAAPAESAPHFAEALERLTLFAAGELEVAAILLPVGASIAKPPKSR